MRKYGSFIVILLTAVLSGCATQNTGLKTDPSSAKAFSIDEVSSLNKTTIQLASENNKVIEERMQEVLDFCLVRLSGFERDSAAQAKKSYWLSMSGLVAGSVIAPALSAGNAASNARAIAALSGWSGATNFAGQALRTSGLSGSTIAETRNSIIRSVRDSVAVASDSSKPFDQRRAALMKARADCILYEIAVPTIPSAN